LIYVTGDTHQGHDIHKLKKSEFPEGYELTKNDYVIVAGDCGLVWYNRPDEPEELWWQKREQLL